MSYTYHGTTDLVALPNRTVQTYPSGLVRVERSFVCRKAQVARFRNTIKVNEPMPFDDGAPAIDGLYIFPEPQEIVRDDGFVEFRVTAYGRTNIFSNTAFEKNSAIGTYVYIDNLPPPQESTSDSIPSINDLFIFRGVLLTSESTTSILNTPNIENISVFDVFAGRPLVPGDIVLPGFSIIGDKKYKIVRTVFISLSLDSYSSGNFGLWSEYTVVWMAKGLSRTSYIQI